MIIESLQNPRVKQLVKLRDRRDRDESGTFLIEGYRELLRASESNQPIRELYFCKELFLGTNESALIDKIVAHGANLIECTASVFKKISYRDRPDGLIGVGVKRPLKLNQLKTSFLIVAESIEKPGNLGTILRTADAVGVDGLIVSDPCTDIYNPNVVRASVGTLFTVPVVETTGVEALDWLKKNGVTICAATPSATLDFTKANFRGPVAIAVGTEQLGLSSLWMEKADLKVKIPMMGRADSLNVAMATTLLLYEVLRQRGS